MTDEQKKLLEPFGNIFFGMDQRIRAMSDEELREMLHACRAASGTNCWCCSFDAAQHLIKEISREQFQRKRPAASTLRQGERR